MLQIKISTEDLTKIRFVISPMLSTVLSVGALFHPAIVRPQYAWLEMMRLQFGDTDLPALRRFFPDGNFSFDFLLPFPEKTQPKFEDELEQIAQTPPATIKRDIAFLLKQGVLTKADLKQYENLPDLHAQAVDELAFFWNSIMQPHWDTIRSVLEGDLMHHSREIMSGGTINMFQGLDSLVTLEAANLLTVHTKFQHPEPYDPQGRGIIFMPNLISDCGVWVQIQDDKPPIISYRAFGAGLWNRDALDVESEAMNILFGENRARLLSELAMPVSTRDLAIRLRVTPGAISQQLGQLKQAGLLESNRAGRSVYYYLNQRGEQLIQLLHS